MPTTGSATAVVAVDLDEPLAESLLCVRYCLSGVRQIDPNIRGVLLVNAVEATLFCDQALSFLSLRSRSTL